MRGYVVAEKDVGDVCVAEEGTAYPSVAKQITE